MRKEAENGKEVTFRKGAVSSRAVMKPAVITPECMKRCKDRG